MEKPVGIIVCEVIFVLGILFSSPVYQHFENTDIGSIFEKEYYSESYYVYLREDNSKAKSYKLKADIIRADYGYESYSDEGEEVFIIQGNGYFVEKIYWNNGGYLYFSSEVPGDYNSSRRIYPGKETQVTDYHGDVYYITLTTEKAPHNK